MKSQLQQKYVDELQDLLVAEWYKASREMKMFIPITFPYLTLQGFMEEATREHDEQKSKSGKTNSINTFGI